MSRNIVNLALDAFLFLITVLLLFTSAVLRFVFPAPTAAVGWKLWGSGYDAWANLQFALMCVIAFAILLHLMLHWSWVCGVVLTKLLRRSSRPRGLDEASQTLWGVAMLIVVLNILGAFVGLAYLMIERPGT